MEKILKEICKDLPYDIYYLISSYFHCQCGAYDNLRDGLCSRCFPNKFVIDYYYRYGLNNYEVFCDGDTVDIVGCIQSALIFNPNYYRLLDYPTYRQLVAKFDVIDPLIRKLKTWFEVEVSMFDRYIYSVKVYNNTTFDISAFGRAVANFVVAEINLKLS